MEQVEIHKSQHIMFIHIVTCMRLDTSLFFIQDKRLKELKAYKCPQKNTYLHAHTHARTKRKGVSAKKNQKSLSRYKG